MVSLWWLLPWAVVLGCSWDFGRLRKRWEFEAADWVLLCVRAITLDHWIIADRSAMGARECWRHRRSCALYSLPWWLLTAPARWLRKGRSA